MNPVELRRHNITLSPKLERVILRSFIPGGSHRISTIIGRALALSEEDALKDLETVRKEFDSRHVNLDALLLANYERVVPHIFTQRALSRERQLLIGALFSGEYALESAALFNPSIVPHPDQTNLQAGALRFILSLRATGEGHISSIEFRSGIFSASGSITIDPISRYVGIPDTLPNPSYHKKRFSIKLYEMGFDNSYTTRVLELLEDEFSRSDLLISVGTVRHESLPNRPELHRTLERIQWLADSNYEIQFSEDIPLSERIIFPASPNESNGIEDARFVRFTEDDGSTMYYATYTAYNGHSVLSQFIETEDFLHFRVLTLNGAAVQNKGMALFPRRIDGRYAMISRQDDENLFIMFSPNLHYWSDPQLIMRPSEIWESVKIGNCGSPIETKAGWIILIHGVGPMRKYCIGAALLDLKDPTKVLARLRSPLIAPEGTEREGYVPNVVYSCGALIHGGTLVLPYALGDRTTTFASMSVEALLGLLLQSQTKN